MGLELELAYRSLLSTDQKIAEQLSASNVQKGFDTPLQVAKAYPAAPEIYRFLSALNHQNPVDV